MALGQPENQVYGFLQGRCNETCRKAGRTSRLEMADESHIMRASSPSRRLQTQQHEFVLHGGRQLLAPDLKLNQPSQQRQRSITAQWFPNQHIRRSALAPSLPLQSFMSHYPSWLQGEITAQYSLLISHGFSHNRQIHFPHKTGITGGNATHTAISLQGPPRKWEEHILGTCFTTD